VPLVLGRRPLGSLAVGLALGGCRPAVTPAPGAREARPRQGRGLTFPETTFAIRTEYPPIPPLDDRTYELRRAFARSLVAKEKADIFFAGSGSANFSYLVGADFGRSERLIALVLPVDDPPIVVAPSFEVPRVRQRVRAIEVTGWEESEDPIATIRDWLARKRRVSKLVVEPHTEYAVAAGIGRLLPEVALHDGTKVCEDLRARKTDDEILRMRRAIEITEDAFAATFARLEAGMMEKDVARIVREEHSRRGADGGALVQFGASAALPHGGPTSAALAIETVVLLDGGCSFQGWQSDITRTRWFGRAPSARFRALYNLVHDAQTAAIAKVAPGVPAQEIDRAARGVIAAGGFAREFTHRLGHGIGMEGHEPVYMVEGNPRPLEPGFVFSVEPGIYLPGEIGIRLEDQVACGASSADVLSRRAPRV
jgi:Xaa-Pro dipeptidase